MFFKFMLTKVKSSDVVLKDFVFFVLLSNTEDSNILKTSFASIQNNAAFKKRLRFKNGLIDAGIPGRPEH